MQLSHGGRGARLEGVGDRDDASRPAVDRHVDRSLAGSGESLAIDLQRGHDLADEPRSTDTDALTVDDRRDPLARLGCELARFGQVHAQCVANVSDDRLSQRVFRAPLGGSHQAEELRLVGDRPVGCEDDVRDAGLALRERARLVEDHDPDLVQSLQRFRVPEEDAVLGSLPRPDHDRRRRREPEGARAGDDEDGDRVEQGEVEGWRRAGDVPRDERQGGDGEHDRDEDPGDGVGQSLDRRPRALGLLDEADDLGQDRVGPHAGRPVGEGTRGVQRRTDDLVAGTLAGGHALAGDHALVDRRAALQHQAIDGDALTWTDQQHVADDDLFDRDVNLRPEPHDPSSARREADELADRVRCVAPGARLEEAAQEDQRDDRGRGVEVERQHVAHRQTGGGEEAREQDGGDAVAERR